MGANEDELASNSQGAQDETNEDVAFTMARSCSIHYSTYSKMFCYPDQLPKNICKGICGSFVLQAQLLIEFRQI